MVQVGGRDNELGEERERLSYGGIVNGLCLNSSIAKQKSASWCLLLTHTHTHTVVEQL